jgi:hypothetical protein
MGFTQPLTEMSTRNIKIIMFLGSKVQPGHRADNLTATWSIVNTTAPSKGAVHFSLFMSESQFHVVILSGGKKNRVGL